MMTNVFQHPCLIAAWTRTYSALRVMERIELNGYPLVVDHARWKNGWIRRLLPAGWSEFDYHDPALSGTSWPELLPQIRENDFFGADCMDIPRVRRPLDPSGTLAGRAVKVASAGCAPYIEMAGFSSFEDYFASRSKNLRQNTKRKLRRLEQQHGPVVCTVFEPGQLELARKMLHRFRACHHARWPQAYHAPGLLENILEACLAPPGDTTAGGMDTPLHFSVLSAGGIPVSFHFGFCHERVFYWWMPAYDAAFGSCSPGQCHVMCLVEDAFRLGCERFDFLIGEERYKFEWADHAQPLYSLSLARGGVGPWLRRCAFQGTQVLRKGLGR